LAHVVIATLLSSASAMTSAKGTSPMAAKCQSEPPGSFAGLSKLLREFGASWRVKNTLFEVVNEAEEEVHTSVSAPAIMAEGELLSPAPSWAISSWPMRAADCQDGSSSLGSLQHWSGDCRPCAHSWRPGGCSKGEACTYCHLCGELELVAHRRKWKKKRRQEAAAAAAAAAAATTAMAAPDVRHREEKSIADGLLTKQRTASGDHGCDSVLLASAGSSTHGKEACKPCAHAWRSGGCFKGRDCEFCHECTEGDFHRNRLRKKQRANQRRNEAELSIAAAMAAATPATIGTKPVARLYLHRLPVLDLCPSLCLEAEILSDA